MGSQLGQRDQGLRMGIPLYTDGYMPLRIPSYDVNDETMIDGDR